MRRTDISPEQFFQALGRARKAGRDEIERLIDWLDSTIDVDEDFAVDDETCEGDPDAEPSPGSFDRMSDQIKAWPIASATPTSSWMTPTGRTTIPMKPRISPLRWEPSHEQSASQAMITRVRQVCWRTS
ncbi:hypothetical protein XH89_20165 [Bradyrhizobium sp. CCBAU 53340]|nr:hypothetical protein XH89_20165 [Bradyrhizobium sp. CCBAU 53340]